MKKISLVIAFAAAIVLAGCNGNKQTKNGSETDSTDVFVEQQIKAGMNMHLDSLTELWLRLKPSSFYSTTQDGKIILSQDEKKVKPEYLFNPEELASKLETMSYKYRALAVYAVDKEVAKLYDMKDVYTPAIKKLAAELNDPSLKFIDQLSFTSTFVSLVFQEQFQLLLVMFQNFYTGKLIGNFIEFLINVTYTIINLFEFFPPFTGCDIFIRPFDSIF